MQLHTLLLLARGEHQQAAARRERHLREHELAAACRVVRQGIEREVHLRAAAVAELDPVAVVAVAVGDGQVVGGHHLADVNAVGAVGRVQLRAQVQACADVLVRRTDRIFPAGNIQRIHVACGHVGQLQRIALLKACVDQVERRAIGAQVEAAEQRIRGCALHRVAAVDHQRSARFEHGFGKHHAAAHVQALGQPPAGELHRFIRQVHKLDPVPILARHRQAHVGVRAHHPQKTHVLLRRIRRSFG